MYAETTSVKSPNAQAAPRLAALRCSQLQWTEQCVCAMEAVNAETTSVVATHAQAAQDCAAIELQ
jgi:hypothetical protein